MKKFFINLILILFICLEIYSVLQWYIHCLNFQSIFHVNLSELNIKILGDINSEVNTPVWQTRLFYNKYSEGLFFTLAPFFRFWDITFISDLLSFAGLFGIMLSVWYFFTNQKKRIWQWVLLFGILLTPCIEMFLSNKIPFSFRLGLYAFVLGCISIFGINKFLKKQKYAPVIVLILSLISVWWVSTNSIVFYIYCIQH